MLLYFVSTQESLYKPVGTMLAGSPWRTMPRKLPHQFSVQSSPFVSHSAKLPGYVTAVRQDRLERKSGGLLVFVKSTIVHEVTPLTN
eukprot:4533785-Amphidinium_carterae.1